MGCAEKASVSNGGLLFFLESGFRHIAGASARTYFSLTGFNMNDYICPGDIAFDSFFQAVGNLMGFFNAHLFADFQVKVHYFMGPRASGA